MEGVQREGECLQGHGVQVLLPGCREVLQEGPAGQQGLLGQGLEQGKDIRGVQVMQAYRQAVGGDVQPLLLGPHVHAAEVEQQLDRLPGGAVGQCGLGEDQQPLGLQIGERWQGWAEGEGVQGSQEPGQLQAGVRWGGGRVPTAAAASTADLGPATAADASTASPGPPAAAAAAAASDICILHPL